MVQRGGAARLAKNHVAGQVGRAGAGDDLQRELTAELCVVRKVDGSHPAAPKNALHPVASEDGAGRQDAIVSVLHAASLFRPTGSASSRDAIVEDALAWFIPRNRVVIAMRRRRR